MSQSPPPKSAPTIDRQTTTPFLLNFCYRSSAFHNLTDFPVPTPADPTPRLPSHLQIYTWPNCTMRELAHLLTTALPNIVPEPSIGTRLAFRLIYPDTSPSRGAGRLDEGRGRYVSKEMGSVVISASEDGYTNGSNGGQITLSGDEANKTLADARFVIGDYVDCAIFPPLPDGSVISRGSVSARGGGMGMRENGYGRVRGGGYGLGGPRGAAGGGGGNLLREEWRRGEAVPFRGSYGARSRPY